LAQAKDAGFNSPEEMIGKSDYDMPWGIQAAYLQDIDQNVMKSETPLTLEEVFELPNGTKKMYLSSKLPLYVYFGPNRTPISDLPEHSLRF
jgi:hypothetical protein